MVDASDEKITRVGDYYFRDDEKGVVLVLAIPHAGKFIHSEWTIGHRNDSNAQWNMLGTREKPTLTPSLHAVGIWHGWVKQGRMIEA